MSFFTEFVLISIFTFLAYLWWCQIKKNQKYGKLPGPKPLPLLGNALDFGSTTELLDTLMKYTKQYGEILHAAIGPERQFILVSDYKLLEFILSNTKLLSKSDDYEYLGPWLGTGLLTSDGRKWKTHRRILTPAFHFQILEQFINVFNSCGEILVEKLEKEDGEKSIDIYPYITLCSLDIICESIMGIKINAQNNTDSDYVRSVKNMCRIIIERTMSPIGMYEILYRLTPNFYTQTKSLKILHKTSNGVISRRRKELQNGKQTEKSIGSKKPFLDILLEATVDDRPLTQEEIREEVDTFMFEGHDTTSSALSFGLFCLANNPEVQNKVLEEQIALFGDNKNPNVTYSDLQNMKYLELVIKETLRLYPSVPFYARKINENLKYNGQVLPAGDTLVIFAYGIQRNPKYFENPETFDPSRFETFNSKLPYTFIPFSAGPRNCIGQKFAMLEMKSIISRVIRKFELMPATPKHTLKLAAETVLKSANGIKISLKRRS